MGQNHTCCKKTKLGEYLSNILLLGAFVIYNVKYLNRFNFLNAQIILSYQQILLQALLGEWSKN